MRKFFLAVMISLAVPPAAAVGAERPPHTAVELYGVHAYSDIGPQSAAAGGDIIFYISNSVPCEAAIYRLGPDITSPAGDELIAPLGAVKINSQPIYPGSYVHVEISAEHGAFFPGYEFRDGFAHVHSPLVVQRVFAPDALQIKNV